MPLLVSLLLLAMLVRRLLCNGLLEAAALLATFARVSVVHCCRESPPAETVLTALCSSACLFVLRLRSLGGLLLQLLCWWSKCSREDLQQHHTLFYTISMADLRLEWSET